MPNRILKESICTSENTDNLNPEEEVLFYRILVNCDDYGRFDARPTIIRAKCFPLKIDKIKDSQINKWLTSLEVNKHIKIYSVAGVRLLQVTTWEHHQQIRAKRSKYPSIDEQDKSNDSKINQMIADDSKCPRNPIQSNPIQSESNPNTLQKEKKCYGEFKNVFLSEDEYKKLEGKFNSNLSEKIEQLSSGIESHGYKYKSHYATILNWAKKDEQEGKQNDATGTYRGNPSQKPAGAFADL